MTRLPNRELLDSSIRGYNVGNILRLPILLGGMGQESRTAFRLGAFFELRPSLDGSGVISQHPASMDTTRSRQASTEAIHEPLEWLTGLLRKTGAMSNSMHSKTIQPFLRTNLVQLTVRLQVLPTQLSRPSTRDKTRLIVFEERMVRITIGNSRATYFIHRQIADSFT